MTGRNLETVQTFKKKTSKGMWADALAQIDETAEIRRRMIKAYGAEWEEAEAV